MELAFDIPPANMAVQIISVMIMIIAPFVAGAVATRRLSAGWRIFWMGAIVFVVSQMLLRIPLVAALQAALGPQITSSAVLSFVAATSLSLTAALFETAGRYAGYRLLLRRDPKRWDTGVMFGLGHGGIESALLIGGLAIFQLVTLTTLTAADLAALPAAQAEGLQALAASVSAQPAWLGLRGAWERIVGIAFHVGMSVLVLQTIVRGEWRWIGYALCAHFLMDFITPVLLPALLPAGATRDLAQQAVLLVALAFALWVTLALRPKHTQISGASRGEQVAA
jgi:uncharacterized membrane protein YhfC